MISDPLKTILRDAAIAMLDQLMAEQPKTEPVRSEEPKKTGKASDCGVGVCHWCGKPIHLALGRLGDGPYWVHSEANDSHCGTFATLGG